MIEALRRMIERLLPWYDRDEHRRFVAKVNERAERAAILAERIRDDYQAQDERLAGRR